MEPRPDLFTMGIVNGANHDFIRSVLMPSFQRYFTDRSEASYAGQGQHGGLAPIGSIEAGNTNRNTIEMPSNVVGSYSVSVQTDPPAETAKFDPIAIFYDNVQSAPSAREISARVRAECTKEHRIALEQALQSLTAEHKLALNSITNVLNAERNARTAEREHFEADRKIMLAEQKRLEDMIRSFDTRQSELVQKELALQAREANVTAITKQIMAKDDLVSEAKAESKALQSKIAEMHGLLSAAEEKQRAADSEIFTMQRKIIGLEETLKLYESIARYHNSQINAAAGPPVLPPCLPFPPTAESRPTGHFRQLQNAPPSYSPFSNFYPMDTQLDTGPSPNMNYESGTFEDDHPYRRNQPAQPAHKYNQQQQRYYQQQQQHSLVPSYTHGQMYPYVNTNSNSMMKDNTYPPRQVMYPGLEENLQPDQDQFFTKRAPCFSPANNSTVYQGTPGPDLPLGAATDADAKAGLTAGVPGRQHGSQVQGDLTQCKDQRLNGKHTDVQSIPFVVDPDEVSPTRLPGIHEEGRACSAPPGCELPDRPAYKSVMSVKAFNDSKIASSSKSNTQGCALEEAFSESPEPVIAESKDVSPIKKDLDTKSFLNRTSDKSQASDPAVDVGRYSDSTHKSPTHGQSNISCLSIKSPSPVCKSVTIVESPDRRQGGEAINTTNGPGQTKKIAEGSYQYSMTFDESLQSDAANSLRQSEHQRSHLGLSVDTSIRSQMKERKQEQPKAKQEATTHRTSSGVEYVVHYASSLSANASATENKSTNETYNYPDDFEEFQSPGTQAYNLISDVGQASLQNTNVEKSPPADFYGAVGAIDIDIDFGDF